MKVQILLFLFFFYGISAQTVYKTPSGTKYHLANCRMVKNVSSALSLDKALRSGLQPCKICRAPVGKLMVLFLLPRNLRESTLTTDVTE